MGGTGRAASPVTGNPPAGFTYKMEGCPKAGELASRTGRSATGPEAIHSAALVAPVGSLEDKPIRAPKRPLDVGGGGLHHFERDRVLEVVDPLRPLADPEVDGAA